MHRIKITNAVVSSSSSLLPPFLSALLFLHLLFLPLAITARYLSLSRSRRDGPLSLPPSFLLSFFPSCFSFNTQRAARTRRKTRWHLYGSHGTRASRKKGRNCSFASSTATTGRRRRRSLLLRPRLCSRTLNAPSKFVRSLRPLRYPRTSSSSSFSSSRASPTIFLLLAPTPIRLSAPISLFLFRLS